MPSPLLGYISSFKKGNMESLYDDYGSSANETVSMSMFVALLYRMTAYAGHESNRMLNNLLSN
jgi:hypothetical protein